MAGFDVTSVELQLCGSLLTQLGGEVREQLDMLRSDVDHLLGTGWQGHAADGFAQGWQQWRAGADEMIDSLENMAELLGVTGREYDAAESRAIGTIGRSGA